MLAVAAAITPRFLRSHLRDMSPMMGETTPAMSVELETQLQTAFAQILAVAVPVSFVVALGAAFFATRRLLTPIEAVRTNVRRLARGMYSARVGRPVEDELAALADDINQLAATLEHTERRRMRLLNDVSHELRTPLTTIEGYMEAILDDVIEPTPEIIATLLRESRRLKRLANDINVLSRAEEGTLDLDLREIDVESMLAGVLARLAPQFDDARVAVTIEEGPSASVVGDFDRLVQVFTNIIGNAISYTPSGESVTVSWETADDSVVVDVRDTGRGIDERDLGRIFERFNRVGPSNTAGTGVGLTIARSIARLHGGDVNASSEGVGRGSVFTVTLPISGPGRPITEASPQPS